MKVPLHYRLLKFYVRVGLKIYFKKWQSINTHNIPAAGPFIFVANHQNAFLDAILVVCGIKRNPWFLARGDVFKKKWIIDLLTFMRIKPVFRFRDGHGAMRKNDRIMNESVSLLREGECILLFGEGNHNQPWTFQNLQRGFAHLALQYIEKTENDITIIPVGLHYEEHEAFNSRVLVTYGEPISTKKIIKDLSDGREKFSVLQKYVGEKIKALILTVPLDEEYEARKNYLLNNRVQRKDMADQLEADRKLMSNWTNKTKGKSKNKLSLFNWFNPLFLYGRLTHLLPQSIIEYVTRKKIKDDQFVGSVKFALGIFLIPIYYLILALIFFLITNEPLWTLGFFFSLPISGYIAFTQD